ALFRVREGGPWRHSRAVAISAAWEAGRGYASCQRRLARRTNRGSSCVLDCTASAAPPMSLHQIEIFAIIASVLVVSRAIAASNVLEVWVGTLLARIKSTSLQIGILTAALSYLSAFIKNVGTLGIFMPLAIRTARRSRQSPSSFLMPLAFGSLVGGTITKIGTSPNLLISSVREELGGAPFKLFDFVAVGLPLTTIAVVFLAFGWRLLPRREGQKAADEAFSIESYTTELHVPADKDTKDMTVAKLEADSEDEVSIAAIVREGGRRYVPSSTWRIYPGDVLVVLADPKAVEKLVAK